MAQLALLRLQRGLRCVNFPKKPHQCSYRSNPATSKQFITKHPGPIALKCTRNVRLRTISCRVKLSYKHLRFLVKEENVAKL